MDGAGEVGRVDVFQRGQASEFGGALKDAVEPAQFELDALRQFQVVVGAGAFQVQRVQQRLRAGLGDGVIDAVEFGQLAPEQHQGRAGGGAGLSGGGSEAAMGAGQQDHAAGQRLRGGGGQVEQAHCACASLTMRCNSPDSSSSRVMSQPPSSSPCRNSCGKVGQLE